MRYVELRTTPRAVAEGTSKRDYIETVLRVFEEFEHKEAGPVEVRGEVPGRMDIQGGLDTPSGSRRIVPRLLLSVDRGRAVNEATEAAKLALELKEDERWGRFIVGLDSSGNPKKRSFRDIR